MLQTNLSLKLSDRATVEVSELTGSREKFQFPHFVNATDKLVGVLAL